MKKLSIILFILMGLINLSLSQNIYGTSNAEITFFSEARLENIEAKSIKCSSVINSLSREFAFKVPIKSFVFQNGLMQEHFNENYMESDKYSSATFTGKIIGDTNLSVEGDIEVIAEGKLTIHGVTVERKIPAIITIKNGKIKIQSAFTIPVEDHKIDIPNNKLTNISQNITVRINAVYDPKK